MPGSDVRTVLCVDSSGRHAGSYSRELTRALVAALADSAPAVEVIERDLAPAEPDFVHEAWIAANFTAEAERDAAQRAVLAESDTLVDELFAADLLVIGAPIYNFSVPAALKAWIDLVVRARKTFRYTESGPEGLLQGKSAYLVVTSGGTPVDGPLDFATGYLRHILGFIGITDVAVIAADSLMQDAETKIAAARERINELARVASRARVTA